MAMSFNRYAGWLSLLAGVAGIGYAVAFVVLKNAELAAVFLTIAPLLAVAGLVAVFERVRDIDSGVAAVLACRRVQAADQEMFSHVGIEPTNTNILGL